MLVTVVKATCLVLSGLIVIRALTSWFPSVFDPKGFITDFLKGVTEPVLLPVRSVLPRLGFIDMSPVVAIVLLNLVQTLVVRYA